MKAEVLSIMALSRHLCHAREHAGLSVRGAGIREFAQRRRRVASADGALRRRVMLCRLCAIMP